MARRTLLACGILCSLLYAGMVIFVPMLYAGYDVSSQTVSELSAIGAPTRTIWFVLGIPYTILVIAFGFGVWLSAGRSRALRVVSVLLILGGVLGIFWPPMHMRGEEFTLTDSLHIVWTAAWGFLTLVEIGFAAAALDIKFRVYSIATIVAMLLFGAMTSTNATNIPANLPTPLIGIWERLNIFSFLVWLVVFAVALYRRQNTNATNQAHLASTSPEIHGYASSGFEGVRDAFAENFKTRNEIGGACCIFVKGEKVVDLWGGIRNKETREPWEEDTMVIVFSASKGLAAMTLAMMHSRGLLNYDELVCKYWPEFAQNGKGKMTVRQLLAHQGGLHAFRERVDRNLIADLDKFAVVLARQKPEWEPGSRQAYHAMSLGFYENELLRRLDPQHRSLGVFFQDEIASPLGIDFYIRLPESVPNSKLAVLDKGNPIKAMFHLPRSILFSALNPRSAIFRALMVNPGSYVSLDEEKIYARNLEVPSGGGVGTARAIAKAYSAFVTEDKPLGLSRHTLDSLIAPAIPSANGFFDEGLRGEIEFSLGFMKTCANWRFGHEGAFGSPGAGGSLGYADPKTGLAYGYVTNRLGAVDGDPRDIALRNALPVSLR